MGDTDEGSAANDPFIVCLSELEGYLYEVHVALDVNLDPDSIDSTTIKCERLLIAGLMLMVEGDFAFLSDEILNGLDILYDNIEEIIKSMPSENDFTTPSSVQSTQLRDHPKLKINKEQL